MPSTAAPASRPAADWGVSSLCSCYRNGPSRYWRICEVYGGWSRIQCQVGGVQCNVLPRQINLWQSNKFFIRSRRRNFCFLTAGERAQRGRWWWFSLYRLCLPRYWQKAVLGGQIKKHESQAAKVIFHYSAFDSRWWCDQRVKTHEIIKITILHQKPWCLCGWHIMDQPHTNYSFGWYI